MRYFAHHVSRQVFATARTIVAASLLADGRYDEVNAREVEDLVLAADRYDLVTLDRQ